MLVYIIVPALSKDCLHPWVICNMSMLEFEKVFFGAITKYLNEFQESIKNSNRYITYMMSSHVKSIKMRYYYQICNGLNASKQNLWSIRPSAYLDFNLVSIHHKSLSETPTNFNHGVNVSLTSILDQYTFQGPHSRFLGFLNCWGIPGLYPGSIRTKFSHAAFEVADETVS